MYIPQYTEMLSTEDPILIGNQLVLDETTNEVLHVI